MAHRRRIFLTAPLAAVCVGALKPKRPHARANLSHGMTRERNYYDSIRSGTLECWDFSDQRPFIATISPRTCSACTPGSTLG